MATTSPYRPPDRRRLRWVTWIAILAPLPYSASRLLWAVGIPVGIHEPSLRETLDLPGWNSLGVLMLVLLAEGTALYTHAFLNPPRERVPAGVPWLGGRRVRPALVVAPLLAPILILASFCQWSVPYVLDGFALPPDVARDLPAWSFWGQTAIFWVWGLALTVAVGAYGLDHGRRRWRARVGPAGVAGGG